MARTRRVRPQRSQTQAARRTVNESQVTSATLTDLLTRTAPSSPVIVQSGIVNRSSQFYGFPSASAGWAGSMPAPPPNANVLWVTFSVTWQIYTWSSVGANNSNSAERLDCGISWRWHITPNPYHFAQPLPEFIKDSGRHEFYTSVSPGGNGFSASWIAPARSKTLTPDSKESDPTPLKLLLSASRNGVIPLWFGMTFSNVVINGREAFLYMINGGASDFHWSYAFTMGKIPNTDADLGPVYA